MPALAPFLHVANGTSTTRTIAAAGIPGNLSIWADPLEQGPVPGGLGDEELLEVRRRFHEGSDAARDPVNDFRRWRDAIAHHDAYDELVLWFEHDLFDQLNLVQLLTWIREHLPATKPVTLVCIGAFPGRPRFKGLGELTPSELAPLFDTRRGVDVAQYDLAEKAWRAFREPTPEALDRVRRGDTAALPFLAAALTRFLEEYPWTSDGLSRTERRLLELAAGGITLNRAFPLMHEGERAHYISDLSLVAMADALSGSEAPLLTCAADPAAPGKIFRRSVRLTETGRSVLRRERDRIATCGIDRWFGGVHLEGRGPLWRWDPVSQHPTRA